MLPSDPSVTEVDFPSVGDFVHAAGASSKRWQPSVRLAQLAALIAEAIVLNNGSATFTRASAAFDAVLGVSVGNNVRRRVNVPVGCGQLFQGDLIERSSTNLLLYSAALDNAAWTKADCTVTADQHIAPDNTQTADLITVSAAPTLPRVSQSITIVAADHTVFAVRVKKSQTNTPFIRLRMSSDADANGCQAWFNMSTYAVGTSSGFGTGGVDTAVVIDLNKDYVLLFVAGKVAAAATAVLCSIDLVNADNSATAATVGKKAVVTFCQAEKTPTANVAWLWASYPTSYIATTSATVTRSADSLTIDTSTLFGGVGISEGTIVAYNRPLYWRAMGGLSHTWFNGNTSDNCYISHGAAGNLTARRNPSSYVDYSGGSWWGGNAVFADGLFHHLALTWGPLIVGAYRDGALQQSQTGSSIYTSAANPVRLGSANATEHADGYVMALYWPRQLSAAELLLLAKAGGVA